jgi:hypothetical protein
MFLDVVFEFFEKVLQGRKGRFGAGQPEASKAASKLPSQKIKNGESKKGKSPWKYVVNKFHEGLNWKFQKYTV